MNIQRQELDVRVEISFDRNTHSGSPKTVTRTLREVGTLDAKTWKYHSNLTNLDAETYAVGDTALLYRTQWEIWLLFKELKIRARLDEINTTDAYNIEVAIIIAEISVIIGHIIVDEPPTWWRNVPTATRPMIRDGCATTSVFDGHRTVCRPHPPVPHA